MHKTPWRRKSLSDLLKRAFSRGAEEQVDMAQSFELDFSGPESSSSVYSDDSSILKDLEKDTSLDHLLQQEDLHSEHSTQSSELRLLPLNLDSVHYTVTTDTESSFSEDSDGRLAIPEELIKRFQKGLEKFGERCAPQAEPPVASWTGVPSSRIGLISRNHRLAFTHQLEQIKRACKYQEHYYFQWEGWSESLGVLKTTRSVVNRSDLTAFFSKDLREFLNKDFGKLSLFRSGLRPIRSELPKGVTVGFQLYEDTRASFFSRLCTLAVSNAFYASSFGFSRGICGVSMKNLEHYSVVFLWLYSGISAMDISALLRFLQANVEDSSCLKRVVMMDNRSQESTVVDVE